MILGEGVSRSPGGPMLFMLALLEVGAVSLLLALLLLGSHAGSYAFASLANPQPLLSIRTLVIGLLLLFGFGAKLGVLPFYEWFPAAYGSGSGATGVIFSGIVLNAAFYSLARAVLQWLPHAGVWTMSVAIIMIIAGVLSAILSIFNAFQEEDWRRMLSLSSAENAGVAVAVLGVSLLFVASGLPGPAALAWIVCLLHLAAHSLAKGTLFLTADGVYSVNDSYLIRQTGLLRNSPILFGVGALFATMSLAALPPQSGFVSEWYVFQTLFQGMQVNVVAAKLTIALAAAGLALVVAVALATFAKLFGIGMLGDGHTWPNAPLFRPLRQRLLPWHVRPGIGSGYALVGTGARRRNSASFWDQRRNGNEGWLAAGATERKVRFHLADETGHRGPAFGLASHCIFPA
jgi:hydrogenase-4 component B